MKWIIRFVLFIVLIIGAIYCLGFFLPAQTTVSRAIDLNAKPEAVFALLADIQHMAEWNRNIEKVDMLPPIHGHEATRQTFDGGMPMTTITTESRPPTHLVRTLGDDSVPFAGSWTYDLTPTQAGGTRVKLTEVAVLKNPLFRVMTRLFGQSKYVDEHLQDLAKKLGETAQVR